MSSSACAQAGQERVQPPGRQHPVQGQAVEVADHRVLRQVPDRSAAAYAARRGRRLARQHPGQRGLPRAVPADQADLVAGRDLERGRLQQQPGASAQLKVVC